jgi:hypothetical protein
MPLPSYLPRPIYVMLTVVFWVVTPCSPNLHALLPPHFKTKILSVFLESATSLRYLNSLFDLETQRACVIRWPLWIYIYNTKLSSYEWGLYIVGLLHSLRCLGRICRSTNVSLIMERDFIRTSGSLRHYSLLSLKGRS